MIRGVPAHLRCDYCDDRDGERMDRFGCWVCPRCEAEGERIWADSLAGRWEDLHQRAQALGGPLGRALAASVERCHREVRRWALERIWGRR